MRSARLAQQALSHPESGDEAIERLEAVQHALDRMSDMLECAMRHDWQTLEPISTEGTIAQVLDEILDSIGPLARDLDVNVSTHVDPTARRLPAGQLGTIIRNGLANAIEACKDCRARRVELSIDVNRQDRLSIFIADTGKGLSQPDGPETSHRPGGHGIGLDLCKRIVETYHGAMKLINVPFDAGAVLRVEIPIASLVANESK